MPAPSHLYVHIPYCTSKCSYCGFFSVVDPPLRTLPELLRTELRLRPDRDPGGWQTLYIGGGTPSALGSEGAAAVCNALRTAPARPPAEWTFEANPESFSHTLAGTLRQIGVTRISLGAQALDDAALRRIGRRHDAAAVGQAVRVAREAGFQSLGLDLIAGLPGVDDHGWTRTLEAALRLRPEHLSVYALSVEPGTPLSEAVARGRWVPPGDDAQMDALALAEERLQDAGYRRYELSNYALEGHACRHNLAVWKGEDYMGIGPAAASRSGRQRRINAADVNAWKAALEQRLPPPAEILTLSPTEDSRERRATRLRLDEGFTPWRDPTWNPGLEQCVARLAGLGLLEQVAASRLEPPLQGAGQAPWRLSARGREVADAVARELFAAGW